MTTPLININNLSLAFQSQRKGQLLQVLYDINANVYKGEFISIVGPSGCGKTTFLKLIAGINIDAYKTILSGEVTVENKNPLEYRKYRKIGFAFQNPVLLSWRNVLENIILPLELQSEISEKEREKALRILSIIGMNDFAKSYPHQLSGGMKQRVNLGRSLIHNPDILLLDEPFGSLDEITRTTLNYELKEWIQYRQQTTILVTHSLKEALLVSDRILIFSSRPGTIKTIFEPNLPQKKTIGFDLRHDFVQELQRLTNCFYE